MLPHVVETPIGIAVTGDNMVSRPQLLEDPSVKPRQKAEAKRLGMKRRQHPAGGISTKANPWIQAGQLRWNARGAATGAQSQETKQVVTDQYPRVVIAHGTSGGG